MSKNKPSRKLLWFGLGTLFGIFLVRRLAAGNTNPPGKIGQLKYWEPLLASFFGDQKAAFIAARVQQRYEQLFPDRLRFQHPALRMHLESRILPGIALHKVLREETANTEEALAILDACFSAHAKGSPMAKAARWLDDLPGGFAVLRLSNRLLLQTGFPKQGWQIEMVEDSPQRIAYNITGCFYLNVLSTYGVPELTAHFCALDDQLYSDFKTISWERTETLGRGDARCNFVFRSV